MTAETALMPTVADAEREAQEATAHRERLEEALREGTGAVTAEEYADAERRERYALLSAEGARKAAARQAEQARQDQAAAAVAEHQPILGKARRQVVDEYVKLLRSCERLVKVADDCDAAEMAAMAAVLATLTEDERAMPEVPIPDYVDAALKRLGVGRRVGNGIARGQTADVERLLSAAAEEAQRRGKQPQSGREVSQRGPTDKARSARRDEHYDEAYEGLAALPYSRLIPGPEPSVSCR